MIILFVENNSTQEERTYFENFDLDNVVTPVKVDVYEQLLKQSGYPENKTEFLVDGFKHGFSLGYQGKEKVQITAPNLKLRVGSELELWNKVMKEVKLKRFAGPFKTIPFKNYIQSPIGLVPKDNGTQTRLIFHLSYPRNGKKLSVNANTDPEKCKVKYPDFNLAIQRCMEEGIGCHISRSDMRSAFRNLGIKKKHWKFLIMKAKDPKDGKWYYFVDKCLPFGASICCALFQEFSNSIAFLVQYESGKLVVNYLDDYLFAALRKTMCDQQVRMFLQTCESIAFPVSMEKTFWGETRMTFLGFLIDTINQWVSVPTEKITKAINMISYALNKRNRKLTLLQLQRICGFLNFIGRAIIPGRAFTRRLYSHLKTNLKPHHHLKITKDIKLDLEMWLAFLQHPSIYCRHFMDFDKKWNADEIDMYSDASKNPLLGVGARCHNSWSYMQWDYQFIVENDPSIEYLELYGVTIAVVNWIEKFKNMRVILFCDNQSVVGMINKTSSSCMKCMVLIRIIVFYSLIHNVRVFAKYVESKKNREADLLSRMKIHTFIRESRKKRKIMDRNPTPIPYILSPIGRLWNM